jgi:hypothetical protein
MLGNGLKDFLVKFRIKSAHDGLRVKNPSRGRGCFSGPNPSGRGVFSVQHMAKNLKRESVGPAGDGHDAGPSGKRTSGDENAFHWKGLSRLTCFSYDGLESHSTSASGKRCIRFREIAGPLTDLKMGIVSAMCIDWDWIEEELREAATKPLLFVTDYDRPRQRPGVSAHPRRFPPGESLIL